MKNGIHTKFILTPIFEILKDCVNATKGIRDGFGSYPLCEYIMQTTFLKMTGASEQKLKCILWELATNDFEFRYEFLKPQKNYGECSSFDQKKSVFVDLKKEIKRLSTSSDVLKNIFDNSEKTKIKGEATKRISDLFENSNISKWQEREFNFFVKNSDSFLAETFFCNIENETISFYEKSSAFENIVFRHRNRCAHNLKSYQENLPKLSVLVDKDYDYQNYFFRFSILVLLDEIFMKMYSKYLDLLETNG